MIALQQHVVSLEEQLLRKDMGASARGSCKGSPPTSVGVEEHVESIVTPLTGRQVNVYLYLCNIFFLSDLLII